MRNILAAAAFAAACATASAQQAIFYEGADFHGREATISDTAPSLANNGLDKSIGSIYVVSGTWEFCSEPDYRGECRVYGPGRYSGLSAPSYRVFSARLMADAAPAAGAAGDWRTRGEPEVSVYDGPNFRGAQQLFRGEVPDMKYTGFNDAIGSIRVLRGTWEFCTDASFRGQCQLYGPGDYPSLARGHANQYSSARPIAGSDRGAMAGAARDGRRDRGEPEVTVYDRQHFLGAQQLFRGEVPDMKYTGFNDAIASIRVLRGTWEFCTDAAFSGRCQVYGPGDYPSLPRGHDDQYSSARPVGGEGRGAVAGGARDDWRARGEPEVAVYDRQHFLGAQQSFRGEVPDMKYAGFNDAIASIRVLRGTWEFCTDASFSGRCQVYGLGDYPSLPRGHDDQYSSARPVEDGRRGAVAGGARDDWRARGEPEVAVYGRQQFQGAQRAFRGDIVDMKDIGFNDAIASMRVLRGTWEFCTDASFSGRCQVYGPGDYPSLARGHSDQYSSARPVEGGRASTQSIESGRRGAQTGAPGSLGGLIGGLLAGTVAGNEAAPGTVGIRIFESGQFGGRSIQLNRDTVDFAPLGFNDRAESVIVEGGDWTLCSDANGGGSCRIFRPGRYPALPADLRGGVSSAYVR